MKKTPRPVEKCERLYLCDYCGGSAGEKLWLHSDGARCIFGSDDDGIVRGSWTGNADYLTLKYPDVCYSTAGSGVNMDQTTCRREQ